MGPLDDLFKDLQFYLTRNSQTNHNLIRAHNKNITKTEDLSFPANVNNWKRVLPNPEKIEGEDILSYVCSTSADESPTDSLIRESKNWSLKIIKCSKINNHYHISLQKDEAFRIGFQEVFTSGDKYGSSPLNVEGNLKLEADSQGKNFKDADLSELRTLYVKIVTENLVNFMVYKQNELQDLIIKFSLKSNVTLSNRQKIVLCGPVLNEKGSKNTTTAYEFFKKRTIDMRLMAEHKYGLRITSQSKWKEFFEKLGEAAVIIELLQNKPSHSTTISLHDSSISSIKGPSFILYNCARIAHLLKEFDTRTSENLYPSLPPLENIDLKLLTQPEEWELFYVYILQFPFVTRLCIYDVGNGKVNPHHLITMLSNMCKIFSAYYRRIKILTDPRPHLLPVMYARIHLLKAIQQIFHNSLRILNIEPVNQM